MRRAINVILSVGLSVMILMGIMPVTVHATGEENPRVIVEEYSISEDEIVPGQEFELTLTIRNTSQFYDIYSVMVSLEDKSKSIYPKYGTSNQCYIDRIYARKNTQITIPLKAADEITSSVVPLSINITYNDNYFIEKQGNTLEIFLPVRLAGDLNVVSSSVPNTVSVGTKARISVTYENTGSKNLYNIELRVHSGDSEEQESVTNLYNLSGGAKSTAEVYLDCKNIGNVPISFYFIYEDENGEKYETGMISGNISVIESGSDVENGETVTIVGGGVSYLTYVLLALIVIVCIVILVVIRKRRR